MTKLESEIEIRSARRRDLAEIRQMWYQLLIEIGSEEAHYSAGEDALKRIDADLADLLKDKGCFTAVARFQDRTVGFLRAQLWRLPPVHVGRDEVFVNEIYVIDEFRGRGVGSALFRAVVGWAKEREAEAIRASVVSSQVGSIGFWEHAGGNVEVQEYVIPVTHGPVDAKKRQPLGFQGTTNSDAS